VFSSWPLDPQDVGLRLPAGHGACPAVRGRRGRAGRAGARTACGPQMVPRRRVSPALQRWITSPRTWRDSSSVPAWARFSASYLPAPCGTHVTRPPFQGVERLATRGRRGDEMTT
jgi:hypothetical protein